MAADPVLNISPSFSSYCNGNLVEIAARVTEDCGSNESSEEFCFENSAENGKISQSCFRFRDSVEEFEFAFVDSEDSSSSHLLSDEIFDKSNIRTVYPIFNRDLVLEQGNNRIWNSRPPGPEHSKIRLPLRKLFMVERETELTNTTSSSSNSSSEADELDGIPAECYCVWIPEATKGNNLRSKKSSSNGSKWKFTVLLGRNHSHGNETDFVNQKHYQAHQE